MSEPRWGVRPPVSDMRKMEAAAILADYISVRVRQRDIDDSELTSTFIAECISEARHQKPAGTYLHRAGWVRPADQTIRMAYRRVSGVI